MSSERAEIDKRSPKQNLMPSAQTPEPYCRVSGGVAPKTSMRVFPIIRITALTCTSSLSGRRRTPPRWGRSSWGSLPCSWSVLRSVVPWAAAAQAGWFVLGAGWAPGPNGSGLFRSVCSRCRTWTTSFLLLILLLRYCCCCCFYAHRCPARPVWGSAGFEFWEFEGGCAALSSL